MISLKLVQILLALILIIYGHSTQGQAPKTLLRSPCPHAIKINTIDHFRGSLHLVCLQSTGHTRPRLEVIQYYNQQVILSKEVDELGTNQLTSFVDDQGSLRVLLAVPDRLNGTSMYSIDRLGRFIEETHTINTQYVSSMSIWRLNLNGEWHLAIANQPAYEIFLGDRTLRQQTSRVPIPDPKPIISILSWRSTYFDSYQRINLPQDGHVNKLEPMQINGQEFLIVVMESARIDHESPDRHIYNVDSLIYKLDFGDGNFNWLHFQYLKTNLALDARSFVLTHQGSLQEDHYIALLGKPSAIKDSLHGYSQVNYQAVSEEYGLIIYKYLGDQFMVVQTIAAPGATKLDTISYGVGDSYVIIALLSEWSNHVTLYLFDGLNLRPVPSPFSGAGSGALAPEPSSHRAPRMMDLANVHLFMAPSPPPPLAQNATNMTSKRTIDNDGPRLPVLIVSQLYQDTKKADSSIESLYHIPINDIISEEIHNQTEDISNYSKRDNLSSAQNLLAWCKSTINNIIQDDFDVSAQQLASLPRVDQARPIELNGDLIIEEDLHVLNLLYVKRIEEKPGRLEPNVIIMEPSNSNFSHVFNQIRQTQIEINQIKQRVDQILVDDGSDQDIFNPLHFDNLILECRNEIDLDPRLQHIMHMSTTCPQIGEIRTVRLNARDISNIQQQALLTGRSMTIAGDVRFEHLILHGSVEILGTLNDLTINDIVFKYGPSLSPIVGQKNFINGLFTSIDLIVDRWNGTRLDRLNFFTAGGEQRVDANLHFNQIIIDSSIVHHNSLVPQSSRIEKLNGIHLDMHLEQIATGDADSNFELPIHFEELLINGPVQLTASSRLSSIDIENYWLNTMFKQSNQNVTAHMDFVGDVHVSYGGDIIVEGPINGILLNHDNVLMRNVNYVLPNPVVFESDVSIRDAFFGKALNGIQVVINPETKQHELAILYNGGTQFLTGDKVLNRVQLGGHSTITGFINGHLNLTHLYTLATNQEKPHRFDVVNLSGKDIRVADNTYIHIDSSVNSIPVNDLCSLAARVSQSTQTQYNRLRFEHPVNFKSLRCASVNGFNDLRRSFLTRYGNQNVVGSLRLTNGLVFNTTINVMSTLNNLNIAPLSQAIAKVVNETRTGHKDHYGDLIVDELFTERINELKMSNVFITKSDSPQIFRAPISFDHLDIENILIIGNNLLTNSFNGLNISDLLTNTLQYDAPQTIYNHVQLNTLQLLPNANFIAQSLNGHQLNRLYADAVLKDVPQQVLAPKNFRANVDFTDRVYIRHSIDGIPFAELRFNLLLQSNELIDGDLEFHSDVIIKKELEIQSSLINDIDIKNFVNTMLYENRPDQKGLRIVGNGSVRFKDVKLNNLVVAGTIQGLDLSKEALTIDENVNGSYDAKLQEQEAYNNNYRLISTAYPPGTSFRVYSKYRDQDHQGSCYIHSCPSTTILWSPQEITTPTLHNTTPLPGRPQQQNTYYPPPIRNHTFLPPPVPIQHQAYHQYVTPPWYNQINNGGKSILLHPVGPQVHNVQQFYPNFLPQPLAWMNHSVIPHVWKPKWEQSIPPSLKPTHILQYPLVDPKFIEHKHMIQVQAIKDLTHRVNKYLSISFYYEIAQKHPLLGPLLHSARNPIIDEKGGALLLLKATSNPGEPFRRIGQSIDIMAQHKPRSSYTAFTLSSRIQETSNPITAKSLIVGPNYYLFILDSYPQDSLIMSSQIIVYSWNYQSGMYDLKEKLVVDGSPTAMKVFALNELACVAVANPKLTHGNHTGSPILYCQHAPASDFSRKIILPISNVFDLDVIIGPKGRQVLIGALSQQDTEQVGDLKVNSFDIYSGSLQSIALLRMVRPLKLHFFRNAARPKVTHLAVSEAITSNDNTQAITRIFSLRLGPSQSNTSQFYESQVIKDNQFYDIQSVLLDNIHTMLFFQSAHSISIYAPAIGQIDNSDCDTRYSLVQRLPTKGANKFLVFNDYLNIDNSTNMRPLGHFLVLSKDDCEQQQYNTLILKARFK